MSPRRAHLPAVVLACLLAAGRLAAQSGEIGIDPTRWNAVRHFDVDTDGRVLEVDEAAGTVEVLEQIQDPLLRSRPVLQGWVFSEGRRTLLLLREPADRPGTYGRLYLHSRGVPGLVPQGPSIDLTSGDFSLLPLNETSVYAQFFDTRARETKRFRLDLPKGGAEEKVGFSIPPGALFSRTARGELFLGRPLESWLQRVDLANGQTGSSKELAPLLPGKKDGSLVFLKALSPRYALVSEKIPAPDRVVLHLLNLETLGEVARSEELPFFTGRYALTENSRGEIRVSCLVQRVADGQYQATGTVRSFRVLGERIVPLDPLEFQPDREQALLDESGVPVVVPKRAPLYVSVLMLRDAVLPQMPSHYSVATAAEVASVLQRVSKELREKTPRQEDPRRLEP